MGLLRSVFDADERRRAPTCIPAARDLQRGALDGACGLSLEAAADKLSSLADGLSTSGPLDGSGVL